MSRPPPDRSAPELDEDAFLRFVVARASEDAREARRSCPVDLDLLDLAEMALMMARRLQQQPDRERRRAWLTTLARAVEHHADHPDYVRSWRSDRWGS